MLGVVVPAVVLTLLYALVIAGLVTLFRLLRTPRRGAILLGFLVYGLASGLLVAWAWPLDSCTLPNFYAVLLGDELYGFSAQRLGDLWPLRVPHVYVVVSTILAGLAGLLAQWAGTRIWPGRGARGARA